MTYKTYQTVQSMFYCGIVIFVLLYKTIGIIMNVVELRISNESMLLPRSIRVKVEQELLRKN